MGRFIPILLLVLLRKILQMVLNLILGIFASDQILLEMWGSLLVQKLCAFLNSNIAYTRMAQTLSNHNPTITSGRGTSYN